MLVKKFTISDCAKQLEVSRVTIYSYIKKGHLNVRKTPAGKPFLLQEDIDNFREILTAGVKENEL